MGVFIQVEVNADIIADQSIAERIVALCPVEMFCFDGHRIGVRVEREDECTLCELCLSAPAGAITIRKSYQDSVMFSRGGRL